MPETTLNLNFYYSDDKEKKMENKIAIIGIFIEDRENISQVNNLLHSFGDKIIGRMGIPYTAGGINVISVIIDATADEINSLTGKLGRLKGISAKTMLS